VSVILLFDGHVGCGPTPFDACCIQRPPRCASLGVRCVSVSACFRDHRAVRAIPPARAPFFPPPTLPIPVDSSHPARSARRSQRRDDLRKIYLRLKAPRFDLHWPTLPIPVDSSHPARSARRSLCKRRSQDIADEAQKAETGPVFNKIWFMIVGGLEHLS
jgi:hypothetical protein